MPGLRRHPSGRSWRDFRRGWPRSSKTWSALALGLKWIGNAASRRIRRAGKTDDDWIVLFEFIAANFRARTIGDSELDFHRLGRVLSQHIDRRAPVAARAAAAPYTARSAGSPCSNGLGPAASLLPQQVLRLVFFIRRSETHRHIGNRQDVFLPAHEKLHAGSHTRLQQ